jgi:hypothetical protein
MTSDRVRHRCNPKLPAPFCVGATPNRGRQKRARRGAPGPIVEIEIENPSARLREPTFSGAMDPIRSSTAGIDFSSC